MPRKISCAQLKERWTRNGRQPRGKARSGVVETTKTKMRRHEWSVGSPHVDILIAAAIMSEGLYWRRVIMQSVRLVLPQIG